MKICQTYSYGPYVGVYKIKKKTARSDMYPKFWTVFFSGLLRLRLAMTSAMAMSLSGLTRQSVIKQDPVLP